MWEVEGRGPAGSRAMPGRPHTNRPARQPGAAASDFAATRCAMQVHQGHAVWADLTRCSCLMQTPLQACAAGTVLAVLPWWRGAVGSVLVMGGVALCYAGGLWLVQHRSAVSPGRGASCLFGTCACLSPESVHMSVACLSPESVHMSVACAHVCRTSVTRVGAHCWQRQPGEGIEGSGRAAWHSTGSRSAGCRQGGGKGTLGCQPTPCWLEPSTAGKACIPRVPPAGDDQCLNNRPGAADMYCFEDTRRSHRVPWYSSASLPVCRCMAERRRFRPMLPSSFHFAQRGQRAGPTAGSGRQLVWCIALGRHL
jgi:hypothetical protein